MKLFYECVVIFFNLSLTSSHLYLLQAANCDSNSRLVVDEVRLEVRLERVKETVCTVGINPHINPHFFNIINCIINSVIRHNKEVLSFNLGFYTCVFYQIRPFLIAADVRI